MQKAADPADISVLFFPAGANFLAMHVKECTSTSGISTSATVLWAFFSSTSASRISGISTSARQHWC